MKHMVGGHYSLKSSAPKLLQFGIDSVLKFLNKMITNLINLLMSDQDDCRTAPATPGLLIMTVLVE